MSGLRLVKRGTDCKYSAFIPKIKLDTYGPPRVYVCISLVYPRCVSSVAAKLTLKQRPPEFLALLGLQRTAELVPRARELVASRRCSGGVVVRRDFAGAPHRVPALFGKDVAVPKTTQSNTSNNNVP